MFKSIYFPIILFFLLVCVGVLLTNNGIAWGIYLSYAGVGVFAAMFIKLFFDWRKTVKRSKEK